MRKPYSLDGKSISRAGENAEVITVALDQDKTRRFSQELKRLMREHGLKNADLCDKALISQDSLKLIKGGRHCTPDNAERITEFFATLSKSAELALRKASGAASPSPFSELWSDLLAIDSLTVVTGDRVERRLRSTLHAPEDAGEGYLVDQLAQRLKREGLVEQVSHTNPSHSSDVVDVGEALWKDNIFFVGGSISNVHVQRHFNRLPNIRYVIHYDAPDFRNSRIHDRVAGIDKQAETGLHSNLELDHGILTILRNPYPEMFVRDWNLPPVSPKVIIGVMGVHGSATHALFRLLLEDEWIDKLLAECTSHMPGPACYGFQLICSCNPNVRDPSFDSQGPHILREI